MSDSLESSKAYWKEMFRASIAYEKAKKAAEAKKQKADCEKNKLPKLRLVLTRGD